MTDVASRPDGTFQGITREKAPEPKIGDEPIHGYRYHSPEFAAL